MKRFVRWLNPLVWWRRQQRAIDREVLIPAMLKAANGNMTMVSAMFAYHVSMDRAWQVDDWELTDREMTWIVRMMSHLPPNAGLDGRRERKV